MTRLVADPDCPDGTEQARRSSYFDEPELL